MLDRRIPLVPTLPAPLQPMDRLGQVIGAPAGGLWATCDDLTGLAGGGNKVRTGAASSSAG